jgi:hypothetical protein
MYLQQWIKKFPFPPTRQRIFKPAFTAADMLQTVWNELDYCVDVCRITNGAHIEHLEGM